MYRLLIVDDEPIIADGLYDEFQGMTRLELDVYKAYSGRQALELLNRYRIDIVVTDIRMPGIDGLQLLEKIRGSWPECRVIFLTGYREFDYAYQAIQYQGVQYVLKTEGYGKIIRAVESSILDIEESFKARNLMEQASQQLSEASQLMRKEYLCVLLYELAAANPDQPELDRLQINLRADRPLLLMTGGLDSLPSVMPWPEKTRFLYTLQLIVEQYLSPRLRCTCVTDSRGILVWLIQPAKVPADPEKEGGFAQEAWEPEISFIKGMLEPIQAACRETLQHTASFALLTKPSLWESIGDGYGTLRLLMDYRVGSGVEMIMTDQSIEREKPAQPACDRSQFMSYRSGKLEILEAYLEKGQRDEFLSLLREICACFDGISSKHFTPALELYYSLSLLLLSYINKWSLSEKVSFRIGIYKLLKVEEHENWTEALEYLAELAGILFDIQEGEQERRAVDTIARIKEYINGHLEEDLSLVKLADLVYFNPSYLSRLFKQMNGQNLSEYIHQARVKKAKQLLEDSRIRINDIAAAVGYEGSNNFIRFFRKITGATPQEYRDRVNR